MSAIFLGLVIGATLVAVRSCVNPAWCTSVSGPWSPSSPSSRSGSVRARAATRRCCSSSWPARIAICAMILPGVSGSFLLLLLGSTSTVIGAVSDRDLVVLAVFADRLRPRARAFSTLLNWLLREHHDVVLAVLIGLMAGSARVLWPWPPGRRASATDARRTRPRPTCRSQRPRPAGSPPRSGPARAGATRSRPARTRGRARPRSAPRAAPRRRRRRRRPGRGTRRRTSPRDPDTSMPGIARNPSTTSRLAREDRPALVDVGLVAPRRDRGGLHEVGEAVPMWGRSSRSRRSARVADDRARAVAGHPRALRQRHEREHARSGRRRRPPAPTGPARRTRSPGSTRRRPAAGRARGRRRPARGTSRGRRSRRSGCAGG
jgi:hypothetical protein